MELSNDFSTIFDFEFLVSFLVSVLLELSVTLHSGLGRYGKSGGIIIPASRKGSPTISASSSAWSTIK